ncbi:hypothetical protein Nepgr_013273 [Nepenthes gracilis]|uniref:AAA+ ATPase domain-containing protein n=1 Tax=Nepenthes gracilis TaxID=150966 RepID=A0AAD3SIV0_NEPGR|nr:hypothetical protein Nepgr_013273 [Nepenthes gracilis]
MEAVALKAADQAAGNCFALAMAKINKMLSYILHYKDNMDDIRSQRNDLEMLKKEIEQRVQAGERKLETIVPLVDDCLKDAEEFLADDKWSDFTDENKIREKDRCCFSLVQMNLKYRYLVSRRAVKKSEITKEKITKMKDCSSRAVTLPKEPLKLGSMPTVYSKRLASRESTLKEIMEALKDKEVRVIGIYGMGGIGKTTLIEEVARQAEADGSLFSEVVMVEVSQAPDVSKMQQHIAERIGLPLQDSKSVDERARKIHEGLKKKIPNEVGDRMLNKGGKQVVVILDNIWKKLDLDRVGIPRDCKITLTTRSKDVCRDMDANKIFEVRGLDDTEATKLFLERAGRIADHDDGYNSVTSELVKKCEGLPLTIVALADALKDRDLSIWKDVAAQLGRPVSARVGGAIEEKVYPVLEWSYNYISGDEKKKFFLLCCLFPLGSSIAVQDLMRYGAGLGLFQHMNSLDETTEQANSWASELKSSSLLLEAEDERHVKLQDVVRATSMCIASKGRNVFQVGSFPELLMKETFRTYTAISMTEDDNHEPLSQFKFPKLEMLLLKGSRLNIFFQGMKCLKVLVMSDMKFQTLPSSITQLKNLRTFHLERCDLSDISAIFELVDLLFLSLRESTIVELPEKIAKLVHLKLLDLTGCSKLQKIHAGVITRLTKLEELYLMGSFENEGRDNEEKVANLMELNSLSYLAVLELHVPRINLLPDDFLFPRLSRFQISIGNRALNKFFSSFDDNYHFAKQ